MVKALKDKGSLWVGVRKETNEAQGEITRAKDTRSCAGCLCLDLIWERRVQARIWTCSDTKSDVHVRRKGEFKLRSLDTHGRACARASLLASTHGRASPEHGHPCLGDAKVLLGSVWRMGILALFLVFCVAFFVRFLCFVFRPRCPLNKPKKNQNEKG